MSRCKHFAPKSNTNFHSSMKHSRYVCLLSNHSQLTFVWQLKCKWLPKHNTTDGCILSRVLMMVLLLMMTMLLV